jgi:hypothetical protein
MTTERGGAAVLDSPELRDAVLAAEDDEPAEVLEDAPVDAPRHSRKQASAEELLRFLHD